MFSLMGPYWVYRGRVLGRVALVEGSGQIMGQLSFARAELRALLKEGFCLSHCTTPPPGGFSTFLMGSQAFSSFK